MLHRAQELRIDSRQPRQGSRIEAIIFSPALDDQAHPLGVRHDHFVPQPRQQSAHPRRMRSRLHRYATPHHPSKGLASALPVSFSLCLEHVDHWELIASRGDRPSHPIWYTAKPPKYVLASTFAILHLSELCRSCYARLARISSHTRCIGRDISHFYCDRS